MLRAVCRLGQSVPCHGALSAAGVRPVLTVARSYSSATGDETQLENRRLWRWGGTSGLMGKEEDAEVSKEPSIVNDFHGVATAACGSSHSAFVMNGRLYTYGNNKYGQLGREVEEGANARSDPEEVDFEDSGALVAQVALGGFHSAAITTDGALWTWGWGGSLWYGAGALGQGNREGASAPTRIEKFVEADEKVAQVVCGAQHTLVLTTEGRLYATGKGEFGRLGRGDTSDELDFEEIEYFFEAEDSILAPDEPTRIVKVGAGNNFSAVLSSSGELWVWGRNDHGQLGLGEEAMGDMYSAERFPRLVRSLATESTRIVDFVCGEHHLVVLTDQGALYEWGSRTWLEPHLVPLPSEHSESLKRIKKLAAGEKFSLALTEDGTVFTWGSKASGCLAQGADCAKMLVEPTAVPASTFDHQKVIDIAASKTRCLAITAEDEYCA